MNEIVFAAKSSINSAFYRSLKKILFLQDPEKVHDKFTYFGEKIGMKKFPSEIIKKLFNYENKKLEQRILDITFKNPIGLAAGFDYDGRLTQIIPHVGFGFHTIGSVTFGSYSGNAHPRLARLPKSRSLLVNKGLKNLGSLKISNSLKNFKFKIPLGVSIAKTNCKQTVNVKRGIRDYVESFKIWEKTKICDYYELNISCPNSFGGEPFTTPQKLEMLLKEIDSLSLKKPLLIKMPIDLSKEKIKELCDVAKKHSVQGLIFGNLTKNRNNPVFNKNEIKKAGKGNFSGLPTQKKSDALISFAYKNYKKKFIIVGCGGIFSAQDAYEKIKLGASLIQLITGMIFQGPQIIGRINHDLVNLLEKDGFSNLSQAVGSAHEKKQLL